MKLIEYKFNSDFLKIINTLIIEYNLSSKYNEFNSEIRYCIDNIYNVIMELSDFNKYQNRIKLPPKLHNYLKIDNNNIYRLTKLRLKQCIKENIYKDNNVNSQFLNTYIVIGYDVPITIKELTVCVN